MAKITPSLSLLVPQFRRNVVSCFCWRWWRGGKRVGASQRLPHLLPRDTQSAAEIFGVPTKPCKPFCTSRGAPAQVAPREATFGLQGGGGWPGPPPLPSPEQRKESSHPTRAGVVGRWGAGQRVTLPALCFQDTRRSSVLSPWRCP